MSNKKHRSNDASITKIILDKKAKKAADEEVRALLIMFTVLVASVAAFIILLNV